MVKSGLFTGQSLATDIVFILCDLLLATMGTVFIVQAAQTRWERTILLPLGITLAALALIMTTLMFVPTDFSTFRFGGSR